METIKWLFFDIGSTLIDESTCYARRFLETTEGTNVSLQTFREKAFLRQTAGALQRQLKKCRIRFCKPFFCGCENQIEVLPDVPCVQPLLRARRLVGENAEPV